MYGWIWRHLPGPVWFRTIEALVLTAVEVFFPGASDAWHLSGEADVG